MPKNIRFVIRQARCVAMALARVIDNDLRFGRALLQSADQTSNRLPVELCEPQVVQHGPKASALFRFEGGTAVRLFLYDRATLTNGKGEDWTVYRASAGYWLLGSDGARIGADKAVRWFEFDELTLVHESNYGWLCPEPSCTEYLTCTVGIFWSQVEGSGYVETNPQHEEDGSYTHCESVVFEVLKSGDHERALAEARRKLASYASGGLPVAQAD